MPSLSFLERYAHIINTPSISAFSADLDQSNRAIIDLLAGWFKDYNFHISIQQVPNARNKYNMLAKIGSGEGGLLLSGHSDTVPFDDNKWQFDPFKAQENDGKLYGLGTCDMKGFLHSS